MVQTSNKGADMIRFFKFIGKVIVNTIKLAYNTVKNIVCNIEAVSILSLASIGTAAVLTELPFHYAVPVFLESAMIIPVVSVLFILLLVTIMEVRLNLI